MIIKGTKQDSEAIRWLQKGASKDKARPVLNGIHVANGYTWSADGFRLHAIRTPRCLTDAEGEIVTGKVNAGEFIAELDTIVGTYPDTSQLLPIEAPEFEIAIDPKYLREALAGMDGPVRLRFYGSTKPMEVLGAKGDSYRYALVMPMHLENSEDNNPA